MTEIILSSACMLHVFRDDMTTANAHSNGITLILLSKVLEPRRKNRKRTKERKKSETRWDSARGFPSFLLPRHFGTAHRFRKEDALFCLLFGDMIRYAKQKMQPPFWGDQRHSVGCLSHVISDHIGDGSWQEGEMRDPLSANWGGLQNILFWEGSNSTFDIKTQESAFSFSSLLWNGERERCTTQRRIET